MPQAIYAIQTSLEYFFRFLRYDRTISQLFYSRRSRYCHIQHITFFQQNLELDQVACWTWTKNCLLGFKVRQPIKEVVNKLLLHPSIWSNCSSHYWILSTTMWTGISLVRDRTLESRHCTLQSTVECILLWCVDYCRV